METTDHTNTPRADPDWQTHTLPSADEWRTNPRAEPSDRDLLIAVFNLLGVLVARLTGATPVVQMPVDPTTNGGVGQARFVADEASIRL